LCDRLGELSGVFEFRGFGVEFVGVRHFAAFSGWFDSGHHTRDTLIGNGRVAGYKGNRST
jgi:hypothetical protein